MWSLEQIQQRNSELVWWYLETVPPRERLARRLAALGLTTTEETALILAVFAAAPPEVQVDLLEQNVADLLATARPADTA